MKVAEIRTGKETFHCKLDEFDLEEFVSKNEDWLPRGTIFEVVEMSESEYNDMTTTQRAYEVFN